MIPSQERRKFLATILHNRRLTRKLKTILGMREQSLATASLGNISRSLHPWLKGFTKYQSQSMKRSHDEFLQKKVLQTQQLFRILRKLISWIKICVSWTNTVIKKRIFHSNFNIFHQLLIRWRISYLEHDKKYSDFYKRRNIVTYQ